MSWLYYLIEANIYLGIFYLCYCLFLNQDTHYTLSRAYLLLSCVFAFVLPVTQLGILQPTIAEVPQQAFAYLPANTTLQANLIAKQVQPQLTVYDVLIYIYLFGAAMALGVFIFRLYRLFKLSRSNRAINREKYLIIQLNDSSTAFSFFNYLFIGADIAQSQTIINHELVHIRQKHSIDIVFLELLKVINWFNPFIYFLQRSLKTVHEYIADEQTAAREQDALTYSSFLLNNAYGIQGSSIAHSFFNYNLLKKRIIMLNKNRSGKLARLKYLAALPLCAGMLCTSTLAFSKDYGWIDLAPRKHHAVIKPRVDSTKYALKLTEIDTKMWQITDKFSITNKKTGVESFYTVNSLTQKDIADFKKRGFEVAIIEREKAQTDTSKKILPPPPPSINLKKRPSQKLPPPPPLSIREPKLPPPPPYDSAYAKLFNYIGKFVRYPSAALESNTTGNVVVSYRLDSSHKIADLKVVSGIGKGCDEEVVRALKAYNSAVNKRPGTYYFATTFAIDGYTKKFKPIGNISTKSNFVGVVVVMAYPPVRKVLPTKSGMTNPSNDEQPAQVPAAISNKSRALITSKVSNLPTNKMLFAVNGKIRPAS